MEHGERVLFCWNKAQQWFNWPGYRLGYANVVQHKHATFSLWFSLPSSMNSGFPHLYKWKDRAICHWLAAPLSFKSGTSAVSLCSHIYLSNFQMPLMSRNKIFLYIIYLLLCVWQQHIAVLDCIKSVTSWKLAQKYKLGLCGQTSLKLF